MEAHHQRYSRLSSTITQPGPRRAPTGKLAAAIFKCHQSRTIGKLADDTAEDTCESAAKTKFTSKTKTTGCAACTNLASTAAAAEGLIDANNNKVYCTSTGTPFGGDDTGNIPTDAPKGAVTKCENGVAKGVSKLVGAIIKCHISRAAGKLADDTAEDTCESTAIGKFTSKTKTTGCDPCTNLASLGSFVETTLDGANSLAFCASSPSGAFLDSYGSF